MTSTDPVRASVRAWLADHGPGARHVVGVACSGGADSMALADATIAEVGAAFVVIVTIDHGLVAGSAEVARGVAAWARGQGAAAVVRAVAVPARASIEAAARTARYAALAAVADELGLATIFVAHTARDQAETVLLRVLRGTGPAGLAGIPARRGVFARPLLAVDRAAIDAYVAARGLPVWTDPMNADRAFARVRVRAAILPALRAENPRVDAALVRLAASAREWTEAIDALAEPHARFPIDAAALARLPAAVRKRALARALEVADVDYAAVHLDAVDRLVVAPTAGERRLDLPGRTIVRAYDRVDLAADLADPPPTPELRGGFELRPYRAGDRMRPLRLAGRSRKLSDLYADARVPRDRRARARVLVRTADATIVWAEHVGLAFDVDRDIVSDLLPR